MPEVKEKSKRKTTSKGKKALIIILSVILLIAVVAAVFINVTTRPALDTDENHFAVGGMVYSDTVEYQDESGLSLKHQPIIRIMQMVWRFCADGDAAKHAEQTPPDDIDITRNIAYIDDGNIYHTLNVYYPEGADIETLPVIIDIHGGGWMYGDKELNEYYCLELAHKGYLVFNISYRLVPDVTVYEQLQDVAAALKWISESDYPKDNIMLTGDSAGGQLAAYSAVLLQSAELREIFGVEDGGLDLTALLLTSPVSYMKDGGAFSIYTKKMWGKNYKDKAAYKYMDLSEIVDYAELPPTYLITSGGDTLAHDQTVRAYELLKEKGIQCEMADFGNDENGKSLPHVFSVLFPFSQSGQQAIDDALTFYQNAIAEK